MTKGYIKYISLSILFFSALSVVFRLAVLDNPHFSIYELGVNLLSEFAGMIFTVLVFNEFLNYRQQLGNTNKFRWMFMELDELVKSIEFPFQTAAQKCINNFSGSLWTKEVMDVLREKIVLSEVDGCVFPAVPWYMVFTMQGETIMRKCERIRTQYQGILAPEIADYLFYLSNNSEMLTDLANIQRIYENDLLLHYARPANLGSYFATPADYDFQVVKQLSGWVSKNKGEHDRQAAGIGRFQKGLLLALGGCFIIGGIGYYIHGRLLYGGLLTVTAVLLLGLYRKYYGKKR